ncbi:MAG: hypothetical protein PHW65_05260, partial [Dehalococcoidales bacterium]|nr:hypothetical protein [Dehalococcoidales bacterium]
RLNNNNFPRTIKARFPNSAMGEKHLREELKKVSQIMRPVEGGPDNFDSYRRRHTELMADFYSMYLLDPDLARETAPVVAVAFEAKLNNNPKLKRTVAELLDTRGKIDKEFEKIREIEAIVKEKMKTPKTTPEEEFRNLVENPPEDYIEATKRIMLVGQRAAKAKPLEAKIKAEKWKKDIGNARLEDLAAYAEKMHNIKTGKTYEEIEKSLTPKEKAIIKEYRFNQELARQQLNVFMENIQGPEYISYLEDYILHVYAASPKQVKKFAGRWTKNVPSSKQRKFPTYKEAVEAGFVPLTQNLADLYVLWTEMNWKGAINQQIIKGMENVINKEGQPIIQRPKGAPVDWPIIDHPAIQRLYAVKGKSGLLQLWRGGAAVDPEAYKYLKNIFDRPFTGSIVKGIETFNAYAKSSQLSFSMFHYWNLTESIQATIARPKNPARGIVLVGNGEETLGTGIRIPGTKLRISRPHIAGKKLLESGAFRDELVMAGLQVDPHSDAMVGRVNKGLAELEAKTRRIPGLNHLIKAVQAYKIWFDKGLWDNYHSGIKAYSFYTLTAEALRHAPENISQKEIQKTKEIIAELINDAIGGQEWEAKFWAGVKGRQILQMAFLAPDYSISNINVARKALWPSYVKNPVARRVLWWYWINMALSMVAVMNALNYAFTAAEAGDIKKGKLIWQNEYDKKWTIDVTSVMRKMPWVKEDDKRRFYITPGKQAREVVRYVTDPLEVLGSKSSPAAQILFEQWSKHQVGTGWPTPWAEDDMSFYQSLPSRMLAVMDKFRPFTVRGNNFAATFPMRRGMGWWQAQRGYEDLIRAAIDPKWYSRLMSEKDYSRLKKEIDEAADMNGLDKEKLFKEANTKVRTQYYSEFWDAFNKKDQKEVERIAEILKNLGVKKSQLIQSGKRRGILE